MTKREIERAKRSLMLAIAADPTALPKALRILAKRTTRRTPRKK